MGDLAVNRSSHFGSLRTVQRVPALTMNNVDFQKAFYCCLSRVDLVDLKVVWHFRQIHQCVQISVWPLWMLCRNTRWTRQFLSLITGIWQGCILPPPLFLIITDYIMRKTVGDPQYGDLLRAQKIYRSGLGGWHFITEQSVRHCAQNGQLKLWWSEGDPTNKLWKNQGTVSWSCSNCHSSRWTSEFGAVQDFHYLMSCISSQVTHGSWRQQG